MTDSEENIRGIDNFCRFFALTDFLSYRPLKIVWADLPMTVRVRVRKYMSQPILLSNRANLYSILVLKIFNALFLCRKQQKKNDKSSILEYTAVNLHCMNLRKICDIFKKKKITSFQS